MDCLRTDYQTEVLIYQLQCIPKLIRLFPELKDELIVAYTESAKSKQEAEREACCELFSAMLESLDDKTVLFDTFDILKNEQVKRIKSKIDMNIIQLMILNEDRFINDFKRIISNGETFRVIHDIVINLHLLRNCKDYLCFLEELIINNSWEISKYAIDEMGEYLAINKEKREEMYNTLMKHFNINSKTKKMFVVIHFIVMKLICVVLLMHWLRWQSLITNIK